MRSCDTGPPNEEAGESRPSTFPSGSVCDLDPDPTEAGGLSPAPHSTSAVTSHVTHLHRTNPGPACRKAHVHHTFADFTLRDASLHVHLLVQASTTAVTSDIQRAGEGGGLQFGGRAGRFLRLNDDLRVISCSVSGDKNWSCGRNTSQLQEEPQVKESQTFKLLISGVFMVNGDSGVYANDL